MRCGECGATVQAGALPMTGTDGYHAPECVSGSRASAGAWAEAVSAAGVQLNAEGFEDQATFLLLAAGELDALAHGDLAV